MKIRTVVFVNRRVFERDVSFLQQGGAQVMNVFLTSNFAARSCLPPLTADFGDGALLPLAVAPRAGPVCLKRHAKHKANVLHIAVNSEFCHNSRFRRESFKTCSPTPPIFC
eukprot:907423-Amphidinium_carterae.1